MVINFKNKSKSGFTNTYRFNYVYDYTNFWNNIEDSEIVSIYYDITKYSEVKEYQFDWYDVGTLDNYIKKQKIFKDR